MSMVAEPETLTGYERFLLIGISWDFYLWFCREVQSWRIRMTFDRGNL